MRRDRAPPGDVLNEYLQAYAEVFGDFVPGRDPLNARLFTDGPFESVASFARQIHGPFSADPMIAAFDARRRLIPQYAWAIPTDEAIEMIANLSPIIELGAGTGYWASLIEDAGGEIACFDDHSWKAQIGTHHEVLPGDHTVLEAAPWVDAMTLMLCWPPYATPMAADCLRTFRGSQLVYVGECGGGCTGDDVFHEMLQAGWEMTESQPLPQWPGIHDELMVYRRVGGTDE